jgi:hypothetical protein
MSAHLTTLPSVSSAEAFWLDQPGGFKRVVLSTLGRSAVIGVGLAVAGERRHLLKYSLFAATAIELMVLGLVKHQLNERAQAEASQPIALLEP